VLAQADLRAIGVPNDRVEAVRALARAFSAGRISFGTGAEAQQVVDALCRIRGVAASMAQWVAMRALREPDAFPSDDSPCSAPRERAVRPSWSAARRRGGRGAPPHHVGECSALRTAR